MPAARQLHSNEVADRGQLDHRKGVRTFTLLVCAILAGCATPDRPSATNAAIVDAPIPTGSPFREEVLRFAEQDRVSPPPACPVLFVGSSSIRMWASLTADMAPLPVLNRGFGGSSTRHVNAYFDRVVTRYRPRAIVLYAGENDIDAGESPAEVLAQVEYFMALKDHRLGRQVPVYYISQKPSKLRAAQFQRQSDANEAVKALADRRPDLDYIDIVPAMLENGEPKDIYVEDGLHMSAAGYAIWRERVGDALRRGGVERLRCRS